MGVKEFSTALAQFNEQQLTDIQTAVNLVKVSVDAIKNTDVALLNTKVGTNADGIEVLTLFGKLAKIIADTSGLGGKIGTNADGIAVLTLFGKLAKIIADTSGLGGKIGANGDIPSAGTIFGKIGGQGDAVGAQTLFGNVFQASLNAYNASVKSSILAVQRGTVSANGTTPFDVNISTVNMSKARLTMLNALSNNTGGVYIALVNAALIRVFPSLTAPLTVSWEIVEYN